MIGIIDHGAKEAALQAAIGELFMREVNRIMKADEATENLFHRFNVNAQLDHINTHQKLLFQIEGVNMSDGVCKITVNGLERNESYLVHKNYWVYVIRLIMETIEKSEI